MSERASERINEHRAPVPHGVAEERGGVMSLPTLTGVNAGILARPGNRHTSVLIPRPAGLFGPVTGARLRRAGRVAGLLWAVGLVLTLLPVGASWRALGAGLQLPGGALLYAGHPVWAGVA